MSENTEIDVDFTGIKIQGEKPNVQFDKRNKKDSMDNSSSNKKDEDAEIDTDFSGIDLKGSKKSGREKSPKIKNDEPNIGEDASETWGNDSKDIRINTTDINPDKPEKESGGNTPVTDSEPGNNPDSRKQDTGDTEISEEDIESKNSGKTNEDLLNEISDKGDINGLMNIDNQEIRNPVEILITPINSLVRVGKFCAGFIFDLFVLSVHLFGYILKGTAGLLTFFYMIASVSILPLPSLVGMVLVNAGLLEIGTPRSEIFIITSAIFLPIIIGMITIGKLIEYAMEDSDDEGGNSRKHDNRFSRW